VSAADDAGVRQPVEIRQPAAIRIYVVAFILFWVGALVWGGIPSPFDVPILVFMATSGLALAARIQMLKLVADDSGLLVRNLFRSWRFRWAEVEDFRLGTPAMGMPFGQVIHVLLRNGDVIAVDITASNWGLLFRGKTKLDQLLKRLREWLPPED
jgi:hypothetical protein